MRRTNDTMNARINERTNEIRKIRCDDARAHVALLCLLISLSLSQIGAIAHVNACTFRVRRPLSFRASKHDDLIPSPPRCASKLFRLLFDSLQVRRL